VLQARQQILNELFAEAQNRLHHLSNDQQKYKPLLKDLILQGLYQIMEENIILQCKKNDLADVKKACGDAQQQYVATLKLPCKIKIDEENPLPDASAGGVVLSALDGRIRCSNALETRLNMLTEEVCNFSKKEEEKKVINNN